MARSHRLTLALILAVAFVLRVLFNTYLLPPVYDYPNEISKMKAALELAGRDFDHGKAMPSFLLNSLYLLYFPVRAAYAWGHARYPDSLPFSLALPEFYLWFGRVYMALFGLAGVWAAYLLGKRLGSIRVGLLASALLAVAPIHVLGSRHMKEDMPLGFFATMAVVCFLDMIQKGRRRDYVCAGLFCGACFSTKWLGAVAVVPLIFAHRLSRRRNAGAPRPRRALAMALACMILGFFLLSPDFLTHPGTIYKGLKRGVQKSASAHTDGIAVSLFDNAGTDYFRTGLWPGMTPPLLLLGLLGWMRLRRQGQGEEAAIVGFWIIFFYLLIETAKARPYPHYQRYLQPLIPCIAALAASGVLLAAKAPVLRRIGMSPGGAVPAGVMALLGLLWPAHDTLRYLAGIPRSSVIQAHREAPGLIPDGALVITDGYGPYIVDPRLRPRYYKSEEDGPARPAYDVFPPEPCYVIYTSDGLGRFLAQPKANPLMTRFAQYVCGAGTLVKEWKPPFRSFYCESPTIRLYRFSATGARFESSPAAPNKG